MTQPLANQVVLITGAGSGLGAAMARALATDGARCVLAGRRAAPLETLAAEIGPTAHVIPTDVTDEAQVQQLVAQTLRVGGRLDVLINNAGIFRMTPFAETTLALWDQTQNSNLRSVFMLCQAAWPHLIESRGQILNVSSVAGRQGFVGGAAYCASKHALNGLTEVLTIEGRPHGIRAVAVCPASVDTPIWEGQASAEVMARMMKPEAIADLVRWIVCAPRSIHLEPVVVRNFSDPWIA